MQTAFEVRLPGNAPNLSAKHICVFLLGFQSEVRHVPHATDDYCIPSHVKTLRARADSDSEIYWA